MIETLCKMADLIRAEAPEHEKKHLIDCVNSLVRFHHEVFGKKDIVGVLKMKLPVPKYCITKKQT